MRVAQQAAVLVCPQRPSDADAYPEGAPSKVTAEQWREGAVLLQREVSDCNLCATCDSVVVFRANQHTATCHGTPDRSRFLLTEYCM
jgi:hypothetical protein